jgi:SAM-dependent methyltransferase
VNCSIPLSVCLALACRAGDDAPPPTRDLASVGGTSEATAAARAPDILYVPTPEAVVSRMLEVARVGPADLVYDLGCGDGRIVIEAARRYGAHAVGFDIDPALVAEARRNVNAAGVQQLVRIEQHDIFELDLSPASVVALYLLPELNVRLLPQLRRLRPGSRVVSHDFDIAGVVPQQELTLEPDPAGTKHSVYFFETPLLERR